jgi:hypothetical protein
MPPLASNQTSLDSGKSVWSLCMRPLDGKKWSRKPRNPSISVGSKPGKKPRTNSMAPKTVAVIPTFRHSGKDHIADGRQQQPEAPSWPVSQPVGWDFS